MLNPAQIIEDCDPELSRAVAKEQQRQEDHIELIASENYVSPAILALQGSVLTNKYAEGYPGNRYYGGCEFVDQVEQLAMDRAKQLFGAAYANVQPHSGSQANAAAYLAMMSPGDTFLAMDLSAGGHLTHGASVSFSGKFYRAVHYGLNTEGDIDYDQVRELARKYRPKLIVAGFSAFSGRADWQCFRTIADEVDAYLMVDMAHVAGLVAAGVYPSPIEIADVTTMTTHKTLRGPRGGLILAKPHDKLHKRLNSAVFPGLQGGPLVHVMAAKAMAFKEAMQPNFKTYQQQVLSNAKMMVSVFLERGYTIISGKTENHMLLIDLSGTSITGKAVEVALDRVGITLNKNTVPGETRSPALTSGIRIGTPAITTRGFKEAEAKTVADLVCDGLDHMGGEAWTERVREQVAVLCRRFPIYSY